MIPGEAVLRRLRRTRDLARRFEEGFRDRRSLDELARLSRSWDSLDRWAGARPALHLILGEWARELMRAESAARKES
jgi:hypothetical protein